MTLEHLKSQVSNLSNKGPLWVQLFIPVRKETHLMFNLVLVFSYSCLLLVWNETHRVTEDMTLWVCMSGTTMSQWVTIHIWKCPIPETDHTMVASLDCAPSITELLEIYACHRNPSVGIFSNNLSSTLPWKNIVCARMAALKGEDQTC